MHNIHIHTVQKHIYIYIYIYYIYILYIHVHMCVVCVVCKNIITTSFVPQLGNDTELFARALGLRQ